MTESLDLSSLKADNMPQSCVSHLVSTLYSVDLFVQSFVAGWIAYFIVDVCNFAMSSFWALLQ